MQITSDKTEHVKIFGSVLLLAVIVAMGVGCEDREDKAKTTVE